MPYNFEFVKMKILAFGATNHSNSINQILAIYIASQFEGKIETLDLNNYEMPIYSIDREDINGIPDLAVDFAQKIDQADLLVISLAEYNGSYSAAFKNIFEWISRVPNRKAFGEKNIFLAATSPGSRGGLTVLESAKTSFPYFGGNIVAEFLLPSFGENFNNEQGILNEELKQELNTKIRKVKECF